MIKTENNPISQKSKLLIFTEYFILAVFCSILALRTTITESPHFQFIQNITISELFYTLISISLLLFLFLLWFTIAICSKKFIYRITHTELALFLFVIASGITFFAASNKTNALNNSALLITTMLMTPVLVQILDSQQKIHLVLAVIVGLAVLSAHQSTEQLLSDNKKTIEFYEQNKSAILAQQNIEPNSLKQWQYEHRLLSKGIRGFFTTRNSAGSFAILAIAAAAALLIDKLKNYRFSLAYLVMILCVLFIIFCLFATRSKGAICAFTISIIAFGFYILTRKRLSKYKILMLSLFAIVTLLVSATVIFYGINHQSLPGGNSMLVRWQYWAASIKMYSNNWLTGVGAGNFANHYFRYKIPAALELISDPHNFPLSIITQFGPLGLIAFCMFFLAPLVTIIFSKTNQDDLLETRNENSVKSFFYILPVTISLALLIFRPLIIHLPQGNSAERNAAFFILFIIPTAMFLIASVLFQADNKIHTKNANKLIIAVLFCSIVGFLIHNLIDFAIFEPGVLTTFCAVIACLIAFNMLDKPLKTTGFSPDLITKLIVLISLIIISGLFTYFIFIPTAKSSLYISKALQAVKNENFEKAHGLLSSASKFDRFNPQPDLIDAKLYLQQTQNSQNPREKLIMAESCLIKAADRDPASYIYPNLLSNVKVMLAKISPEQEKNKWLQKAYESCQDAFVLYPGSDQINVMLADIALTLGDKEKTIEHYSKAIEIEKSFRSQFSDMYPDSEIFSRMGQQRFEYAKQQVEKLKTKP